ICPIAGILAAAMMMDTLGEEEVARDIENAVAAALATGRFGDLSTTGGVKTYEYGDYIAGILAGTITPEPA
ncbi:MAG: isocitrate/isopropylmalate family dehydrogenase, partial [Armatimonadetes bacterium]|nr:isocitrate/isopropylmalate family dehydrogenase [Armatimonadota bacterium]